MAKMLVVYNTPKDQSKFDEHYFGVHAPLAKTLPGLIRYDVSKGRITGRSAGVLPYMIATLEFGSMDDIRAAFASEIGKACADDVRLFAPEPGDAAMFLFDEAEV